MRPSPEPSSLRQRFLMPTDQGTAGALQLKWELTGRGWARCHLADDSQTASVIASCCTDALADLVAGAVELYGQRRSVRFFFDLPHDLPCRL